MLSSSASAGRSPAPAAARVARFARSAIVTAIVAACSGSGGAVGPGGGGGSMSISALSPTTAPRLGSTFTLTVTGQGFPASGAIIMWGATPHPATRVDATHLSASIYDIELSTQGPVDVKVLDPNGALSNILKFTVGAAFPVLTSITPTSATAGGVGRPITATGSEFTATSVVRWNGSARPTTFVSATELTGLLTAQDLAAGAVVDVTVYTPESGASAARQFTVNNPAPVVTSISPSYVAVGAPATTVVLTGTGMMASSVVRWNGADRPTTYVSPTQLSVTLPATDLATMATSELTVRTPTPGGGTSSPVVFTTGISSVRTVAMRANDLVADAGRSRLYASVAAADATRPNAIAKIDPATGTVEASLTMAGEPSRLAVSGDGQYLYVSLAATGQVARVDLATFTAGPVFVVGTGTMSDVYWAEDIDVLPGAPTSVAIARHTIGTTGHGGIAVYDNGVRRTAVTSEYIPVSNQIEFLASAGTLYGGDLHSTSADFQVMSVAAGGVTVTTNTPGLLDGNGRDMVAGGDKIYFGDGIVVQPSVSATTVAGRYPLDIMLSYFVRPDAANGRVHFVAPVNINGSTLVSRITTFNTAAYDAALATLTVPEVPGVTGRMVRWSTDGLGFPSGDRVVLVRTNLVGP